MTAISTSTLSADELAPASVQMPRVYMSNALISFLLSVSTFGLLPLWIWPRRWQRFTAAQRRELNQLAQFSRQRAAPTQVARIDAAVGQLNSFSVLTFIPFIVLAAVGGSIAWLVSQGFTLDQIVNMTYRDRWIFLWWNGSRIGLEPRAFWMTALMLAYASHWMAVRSHAIAVDSLAAAMGTRVGVTRTGLNFFWIAAAVGFCALHIWWGIPLVLAGAMQRGYVKFGSPQMHAALTNQFHRSADGSTKICRTYRCGARLAPTANFCPRCGAIAQGAA